MEPITSRELDEVIDSAINGPGVDQCELDKESKAIAKAINGSKSATAALQGAIFHIITHGPDNVKTGLTNSVAAFFLVAMKLVEHRQKAAKDIDELAGLFPDASEWRKLIDQPGEPT